MLATLATILLLTSSVQATREPIEPTSIDELPKTVSLETRRRSFNRRYYAVLHGGRIYYKANQQETGLIEGWRPLPTPDYIDGKVSEIAVGDTYVIAVTHDRRIHTMTGFLEEPARFRWIPKSKWGAPFWQGKGMALPETTMSWDISYNSVAEDQYYVDSAGNKQSIGSGCTSIYTLDITGQNITYIDPWLPSDLSYRVCGPQRNAFVARALSASGSTLFLINRYGDMYVRTYDFDIAGGDWFFFAATYEDMSAPKTKAGVHATDLWRIPRSFAKRYRDVSKKPRQLPVPDWARQEKIRGSITDRITVVKEGPGGLKRHLRVEGMQNGRSGYFHTLARFAEVDDTGLPIPQRWEFVPTDEPIQGRFLENRSEDSTQLTLGPTSEVDYRRDVGRRGRKAKYPWTASITGFDAYCSPSRLVIRFGRGEKLALVLHTRETIRLAPRSPGLDDEPLELQGAVELPADLQVRPLGEASRWFLKDAFGKKRFVPVKVRATKGRIEISRFAGGLVLERE